MSVKTIPNNSKNPLGTDVERQKPDCGKKPHQSLALPSPMLDEQMFEVMRNGIKRTLQIEEQCRLASMMKEKTRALSAVIKPDVPLTLVVHSTEKGAVRATSTDGGTTWVTESQGIETRYGRDDINESIRTRYCEPSFVFLWMGQLEGMDDTRETHSLSPSGRDEKNNDDKRSAVAQARSTVQHHASAAAHGIDGNNRTRKFCDGTRTEDWACFIHSLDTAVYRKAQSLVNNFTVHYTSAPETTYVEIITVCDVLKKMRDCMKGDEHRPWMPLAFIYRGPFARTSSEIDSTIRRLEEIISRFAK